MVQIKRIRKKSNHTNNRKITENMNSIPQSRSQTNVNRNS